jgi:hypothetical protein
LIVIPVGSTSVPTKTDYEVAGVVPVGSESSCALVVLEVGKVAIVVLNVANGLTALELVVELLRLRQSDRRSSGQAEKSEKSGSELHVAMIIMIAEGLDGLSCLMNSKSPWKLTLLYIIYLTDKSDAHGSTCRYSA